MEENEGAKADATTIQSQCSSTVIKIKPEALDTLGTSNDNDSVPHTSDSNIPNETSGGQGQSSSPFPSKTVNPQTDWKRSEIYSCFGLIPAKDKGNMPIYACKFCNVSYVKNFIKMNHHIISSCTSIPEEVRQLFKVKLDVSGTWSPKNKGFIAPASPKNKLKKLVPVSTSSVEYPAKRGRPPKIQLQQPNSNDDNKNQPKSSSESSLATNNELLRNLKRKSKSKSNASDPIPNKKSRKNLNKSWDDGGNGEKISTIEATGSSQFVHKDLAAHGLKQFHYAACLLSPKLKSKGILNPEQEAEGVGFITLFAGTTFNLVDCILALKELDAYRNKSGEFAHISVWKSAENFDPIFYWNSIAPGIILPKLAVLLLGMAPFDPKAFDNYSVPSTSTTTTSTPVEVQIDLQDYEGGSAVDYTNLNLSTSHLNKILRSQVSVSHAASTSKPLVQKDYVKLNLRESHLTKILTSRDAFQPTMIDEIKAEDMSDEDSKEENGLDLKLLQKKSEPIIDMYNFRSQTTNNNIFVDYANEDLTNGPKRYKLIILDDPKSRSILQALAKGAGKDKSF